jgi:ATP-binding cassette subfamily B protein
VSTLALVLMIWIDPVLTLLAMIPLAILPAAVFLFGRQIHDRFEKIQSQFAELSNYSQEFLSSIRIVKAYTQEEAQVGRFAELNEEYLNRNMSLARVWGAFHPSLILLTGLGAVILLWYGGSLVIAGRITVGDFVAFGFYLTLLSWPMIALGWVTNLFQRGAASMRRINELPVHRRGSIAAADRVGPGARRAPERFLPLPGHRTLGVEGHLARHRAGTNRGDRWPDREWKVDFLFGMRLKRNIALHDAEKADIERLMEAVDIAHLTEALAVLPEGIDTHLGERGINLSGGQKQRAALARALYRDTPVLILDDALSAVDSVTETAILRELKLYMRGRSSILVSHRVSAVRDADVIFVLEEGRLVEQGRHRELVELDGVYKRLLERQLLSEEIEREETLVSRTAS